MEGKKSGQIQGRISMRRLVSNIAQFQQDLLRKFHSSKYGKKKNRTNTGKNKHENAGLQSRDTVHHYQPTYQI